MVLWDLPSSLHAPCAQRNQFYIWVSAFHLVGISRLYLGAHWFTDVLSSWLLASAILILVILSYERQTEAKVNPLAIFMVALLSLIFTYGIYHHLNFRKLKINYAQVNYPIETVSMNDWWNSNDSLPAYTASLFGFRSHPINIVWAGDLNKIHETLLKEGWSKPPARDLVSTLHRIADIKSTQYLSMISPQYLDKRPALILARSGVNDIKGLMVLRIWDSNRSIGETHTTLWVGVVSLVTRSYSWLYNARPGEIAIDSGYIFPNKTGLAGSKIIDMNLPRDLLITFIKNDADSGNKKIHKKK